MKAESLNDFLAWQAPEEDYIISNNILLPQTKLVLYGKFGSWKSMSIMDMAFHLASGTPWFGYDVKASVTYLLQVEIPRRQFQKRLAKYAWGNKSYPNDLYLRTEHNIKLDQAPYLKSIELDFQAILPKVLIVDPLYKVITGELTKDDSVRRFQDEIDRLIDIYKVAVVIVHHDRKATMIDGKPYVSSEDIFGSSIWSDWFDTQIRLIEVEDAKLLLRFEKARHAEERLEPISVTIDRKNLRFGLGI